MGSLIAALGAALPKVIIGVLSRVVTQKVLTKMLQKVVVYGAQKAASMTTNKLDDELVKDIVEAFEKPQDETGTG